jgi:hypothetical protein
MSNKKAILVFAIICHIVALAAAADITQVDLTEAMKESLVFLNVSAYSYEQFQPWKPADLANKYGYGCAVGPYQVLTTSWTVSDAAFIKARRYGRNEFIPATVKVVDYECNLALLELDEDTAGAPLVPVKFLPDYKEGTQLTSYWLSSGGHLTTGRGFLDRAQVRKSTTSYASFLNYIVSNTSRETDRGQVYCDGEKAIGIACWSSENESGLLGAVTINKFLEQALLGEYKGFGAVGFATRTLLDPTMRSFLRLPENLKHGVYVSNVYKLGTGSKALKQDDVILAIDGEVLNPYGRFLHPDFDRISFHHLITGHKVGENVTLEIFRDGQKQTFDVLAQNFNVSDMLVPYYEFDKAPEYFVTGGFVFQKLTRRYLEMWGDEFGGKVPPHLYQYYRDNMFKPTKERKNIVVLSYVLPHNINLGYQRLGRIVVSKFNGMEVSEIPDILEAKTLNSESRFDVVEFEMDYPNVVIARDELPTADMMISRLYGIRELKRIEK